MAHQLRVLAALLERTCVQFPARIWQHTTVCNFISIGSNLLAQINIHVKHYCTYNKQISLGELLYIDLWSSEVSVHGHLVLLLLPDGGTAPHSSGGVGCSLQDGQESKRETRRGRLNRIRPRTWLLFTSFLLLWAWPPPNSVWNQALACKPLGEA